MLVGFLAVPIEHVATTFPIGRASPPAVTIFVTEGGRDGALRVNSDGGAFVSLCDGRLEAIFKWDPTAPADILLCLVAISATQRGTAALVFESPTARFVLEEKCAAGILTPIVGEGLAWYSVNYGDLESR